MGTRQSKLIRKQIRKKSAEIKIQGLQEFLDFAHKQGLWRRVVFAVRIVFKKLSI